MQRSIYILTLALVFFSLLGNVQSQSSSKRDFCFDIIQPGKRGCPVGENIPAETPLLEAIRQRNIELVKHLISEGADVNQFDSRGLSPLLLVSGGDFELIDILLKAGANVNAQSKYGGTPLINSVTCSKAVEKFLESGASVNHQNINKKNALMAAAESGNIQSVRLLLAAGADIGATNVEDMTPLAFAVKSGEIDVVKLLFESGPKNYFQNESDAAIALSIAASNPDPGMSKMLLAFGANPNAKGKYGTTAITVASMRNNIEVVRLLIDSGADVNIKGPQTAAPLTWAADYGHNDVVNLLLSAKADVNINDYWPPLITAARKGQVDTMRILIKAGANLNATARDGKTALMETAERGMVEVVRALIENGADLNFKSSFTEGTALFLAKKSASVSNSHRLQEVIQLLKDAGAIE